MPRRPPLPRLGAAALALGTCAALLLGCSSPSAPASDATATSAPDALATPSFTPAATPEPPTLATYRNKSFGIRFDYPSGWKVKVQQDKSPSFPWLRLRVKDADGSARATIELSHAGVGGTCAGTVQMRAFDVHPGGRALRSVTAHTYLGAFVLKGGRAWVGAVMAPEKYASGDWQEEVGCEVTIANPLYVEKAPDSFNVKLEAVVPPEYDSYAELDGYVETEHYREVMALLDSVKLSSSDFPMS